MIELIYYPKCSTSNAAKKFLKSNNISFSLRDITEKTPTEKELKTFIKHSKLSVDKFFNTSGNVYRTLKLKDKKQTMTFAEKILLLSENPMLIKRPILITNNNVLIGYNKSQYIDMLIK